MVDSVQYDPSDEATRVAIACQGGGSHTAFTAGVLRALFSQADWDEEYRLVGISGTSGGAFNALAAWYGLVTAGPSRATMLLEQIWHDLAAEDTTDRLLNQWVSAVSGLRSVGAAIPEFSPYQLPGSELGKERIREVLEAHIDFGAVPSMCGPGCPDLVVGTVDVEGGVFETFVNEAVTTEAVLASAAVPELFEAVEIDGHAHWDGLFSQNPPIDDLMRQSPQQQPEELWVIQINPQEIDGEPTTLREITDRRNELSGNISLNQELRFVERVNDWIDAGKLSSEEFTKTEISRIEMPTRYDSSSKANRDVQFIEQLLADGHERGTAFLE